MKNTIACAPRVESVRSHNEGILRKSSCADTGNCIPARAALFYLPLELAECPRVHPPSVRRSVTVTLPVEIPNPLQLLHCDAEPAGLGLFGSVAFTVHGRSSLHRLRGLGSPSPVPVPPPSLPLAGRQGRTSALPLLGPSHQRRLRSFGDWPTGRSSTYRASRPLDAMLARDRLLTPMRSRRNSTQITNQSIDSSVDEPRERNLTIDTCIRRLSQAPSLL